MVLGIDQGPGDDPITVTDVQYPERLTDSELQSPALLDWTRARALVRQPATPGQDGENGLFSLFLYGVAAVVITLLAGALVN